MEEKNIHVHVHEHPAIQDDENDSSTTKYKTAEEQSSIERLAENGLWSTRWFVIFAVIFGLLASLVLFLLASLDILAVVKEVWLAYFGHEHPENLHADVVGNIIGAVDLYLIAVVLLIFSFGLYELFISPVDVAKESDASKVLEIHSLDQLKDKISKVIIMVLVVSFFQRVLSMPYATPLEMMYLAISIFALSTGLYFLHKSGNH